MGNVLDNRNQAWSHHLKKAKSLNLQCFSRYMSKVSWVFRSWDRNRNKSRSRSRNSSRSKSRSRD